MHGEGEGQGSAQGQQQRGGAAQPGAADRAHRERADGQAAHPDHGVAARHRAADPRRERRGRERRRCQGRRRPRGRHCPPRRRGEEMGRGARAAHGRMRRRAGRDGPYRHDRGEARRRRDARRRRRQGPRREMPVPGVIPAHAGSTAWECGETTPRRDHPRACGEHSSATRARPPRTGSSPRMRGALDGWISYEDVDGIIPAHAGSTYRRS